MEGEWVVGYCLCKVCASRRFCRFRDQNNQVQYSYDSNEASDLSLCQSAHPAPFPGAEEATISEEVSAVTGTGSAGITSRNIYCTPSPHRAFDTTRDTFFNPCLNRTPDRLCSMDEYSIDVCREMFPDFPAYPGNAVCGSTQRKMVTALSPTVCAPWNADPSIRYGLASSTLINYCQAAGPSTASVPDVPSRYCYLRHVRSRIPGLPHPNLPGSSHSCSSYCDPSIPLDPGISLTGRRLRLSASSVGVYSVAGSHYPFNIEGEMTVSVSKNGIQPTWINLDEFSLRQTGQIDVLGYTMTDSQVEPANFFQGSFSSSSQFQIYPSNNTALGATNFSSSSGGGRIHTRLTLPHPAAGTYNSTTGNITLDLPLVTSAGDRFDFHIETTTDTAAPTPAPAIWGPGSGPWECTSPAGAALWFYGYDYNWSSDSHYDWSVTSAYEQVAGRRQPYGYLDIPISYGGTPSQAHLHIQANNTQTSSASYSVMVVDSFSPVITSPLTVNIPCDWEQANGNSCVKPTDPTALDTCDLHPTTSLQWFRIKNCDGSTLFEIKNPPCLSLPPSIDRTQLSQHIFEIEYRVADRWGNPTIATTRFQIKNTLPGNTCFEHLGLYYLSEGSSCMSF